MTTKTIREIALAWKSDKQRYVKQSTYAAYVLILENHILPSFGDCEALSEKLVQEFVLQKLNGGLSIKTVKDILIVLKMVMKFGVKNEWMNYCEWDIKYPTTETNKEIEVLTVAHHKKILDFIKQNFTFRNLGIYISLTTGLRIGEICGLKWSDINTDNGTITVNRTIERIYMVEGERKHTELVINTPKTKNSCRAIPMNKELLAMVKPLKKVVNTDFYVLTNEEKPTEPRTYRNYYHRRPFTRYALHNASRSYRSNLRSCSVLCVRRSGKPRNGPLRYCPCSSWHAFYSRYYSCNRRIRPRS